MKGFYVDFMSENSRDQKKLFKATRDLLLPKDDLCFHEYADSVVLVNDIGRFFHRKIMNIRTDLDANAEVADDIVQNDPVFDGNKKLENFLPLTAEEVTKLIQKSSKKSCNLDPMTTSLVVGLVDELLPIITKIVNSSLSLGYFPDDWRVALVDPRLKKAGQAASLLNMRPVSNLLFYFGLFLN